MNQNNKEKRPNLTVKKINKYRHDVGKKSKLSLLNIASAGILAGAALNIFVFSILELAVETCYGIAIIINTHLARKNSKHSYSDLKKDHKLKRTVDSKVMKKQIKY